MSDEPLRFGPASDPAIICPDYRRCDNHCGTGPCSRRCTVCHRMAFGPTENGLPCPACPDHPPKKAEPDMPPVPIKAVRPVLPEDYLAVPWFAMPDDLIGGWCIMLSHDPPSRGGAGVGDFISEESARHVAELHNAWLEHGRSWE